VDAPASSDCICHFSARRFNKSDIIVSPSILSADFANLGEQVCARQFRIHILHMLFFGVLANWYITLSRSSYEHAPAARA